MLSSQTWGLAVFVSHAFASQAGRLSDSPTSHRSDHLPAVGQDKNQKRGESMRTWKSGFITSFLVLRLFSGAMAQTTRIGVPYPTQKTPEAIDRGALTAGASATPLSVTVALK